MDGLALRVPTLEPAVAPDERVGRAVVLKPRVLHAFQLGKDTLRQSLSQFDAPLVERIDLPDHPLREDTVLVERNQLAERFRRQPICEKGIRRAISFANAVRHQPVRRALGSDLVLRLTKGKRFGLGEEVRHQYVVVAAERIQCLAEADEITRDEAGSLVEELVE